MITVLKTAPVLFPVSLEQAKEHLNITAGWTEDDDILKRFIRTATNKAEQFLRRRLITQTWYSYYDNWPRDDSIVLPFGQLQSVTEIKYTDTAGDQTPWSDAEYNTDILRDPGRVVLEYGFSWPTAALHPQNPIEIEFVCGYGAGADVEDMIKSAILLMLGGMYENREDVIVVPGLVVRNLQAAESLMWPKRIHERPTE